ncbi:pyruvate kinase alpha/beta domain-containing protein [Thermodesulfobacteriota bacterium]
MEQKIVYFENPGEENTDEVLRIVRQRAEELGIRTVVVASTSGATAVRAVEVLDGIKVVVVTHFTGRREPNAQEFTEENRQKVEGKGGKILTGTYAFAALDEATRKMYKIPFGTGNEVTNTLRIFGQGVKVACEISLMAADAGLARTDEEIIAIGGTRSGADVALVLKPVNCWDFFNIRIKEILCKPHF